MHSISKIRKKAGNCIVVGNTLDSKSEKNIEWEFEIDSNGTLIRSSPPYIEALYEATKLNEVLMKKVWSKKEQIRYVFNEVDINGTWVVNEEGYICRTE